MLSLEKISVAPSQRYLFPVIIQFEIFFFFLLDTVESVFGMVSEGPGRSRKQKETRVLYRQVGGLGENLIRHCHHRRQHSQANPLPSLKGESILGTAALYNKTPLLLFSYWVLYQLEKNVQNMLQRGQARSPQSMFNAHSSGYTKADEHGCGVFH